MWTRDVPRRLDEALLIFLRYPEAGKVKTRLIPTLGAKRATAVYRKLAEQVVKTAVAVERSQLLRVVLVDPPERLVDAERWLGPGFQYRAQASGDLGNRLLDGFRWAFDEGAERVAAIGTDCIELSGELIVEAYERLHDHDAVIGPAHDGGYYLLGLARFLPEVFRGIPWSTDQTAAVTLARLEAEKARTHRLRCMRDIDTQEDLEAAGLSDLAVNEP